MDNISQKILEALQEIPKWKVMTYKTLADKFWVHPRKVAMTMKYNKYPDIYPCYKVISHSGSISWYSGENGVDWKICRLRADRIEVQDGKIERKYII